MAASPAGKTHYLGLSLHVTSSWGLVYPGGPRRSPTPCLSAAVPLPAPQPILESSLESASLAVLQALLRSPAPAPSCNLNRARTGSILSKCPVSGQKMGHRSQVVGWGDFWGLRSGPGALSSQQSGWNSPSIPCTRSLFLSSLSYFNFLLRTQISQIILCQAVQLLARTSGPLSKAHARPSAPPRVPHYVELGPSGLGTGCSALLSLHTCISRRPFPRRISALLWLQFSGRLKKPKPLRGTSQNQGILH